MCNKWLTVILVAVSVLFSAVSGIPHLPNNGNSPSRQLSEQVEADSLPKSSAPSLIQNLKPVIMGDKTARDFSASASNRTGRFFGLTTGASGSGLQLGLSFIVPFLTLPSFGSLGSTYGTTTSTYGTTGTTSLLGFNTGSIILVVVIALAAIIFIPYLIYLVTGVGTSPFGRSDDIQGMLTNLASRVDDALHDYNIDAPSCMQRAICTYVKTATKKMSDGNAGSTEKIIEGIATSPYLNSIVDGTKIQQAIDTGRKPGTPCSAYFVKCPYNVNSIYRSLYDYLSDYNSLQQN